MSEPKLMIDKTVNTMRYLFRSTGMNIKIGDKPLMNKYWGWFLYTFNFIWLNIDVGGSLAWFFSGIAEHKNFTELTYVAPCIVISNICSLKATYLVIYESKVNDLMQIMRGLETDQQKRISDSETENIIKTEDGFVNKVIRILNVFYIVVTTCFAISPMLLVLLNYLATGRIEWQLPFLIVYPFDPFEMKYYPWVYLHQVWSETIVVLEICVVDFLFYIFCTYLRVQFRLLGHYIQEVIPEESKSGRLRNLDETKSKMKELVKWHQKILGSVEVLESLYTRSTLFNFVSSSVLMCLTGFNVMAIDDVFFIFTFICFLAMSMLQIFFLCYFGDLLTESSMAVGDAVYNSRWYLGDTSLGKTMLLIQTRAQTPCKLTASNFADVNLMAFMKICSTAWSYFALLQTMYAPPLKLKTFGLQEGLYLKKNMSKPLLFEKSIDKLDVLFRFSGMNMKRSIVTPMDFIKHRWLYIFNFFWVLSATLASFYYIIVGIAKGKTFLELTSVAPCLTFTILAMIKSHFHLVNEKYVKELVVLLRELEIKENLREECEEKQEIIDKETGFLNAVINILYVLNCSMLVVFDMIPLVLIAVKYFQTNEFELLLPYLDVFSFIPYEFKYWPFAYIHQVWSECIVLLEMGAADYLFCTCCTYIRVQFKLLQYDFERIIPSRSVSKGEVYEDVEFQEKFTELVKWHQDLIHSSDILEIIYSKSTLFNFLSSSLVICLTGFNVTIVDDIEMLITFLTFLFMGLMQVFFVCFYADMLMSASTEVSNAVYNCNWYLASSSVGKQLLLVQTRAQEPCKLTAAGFADVNLRAFMRVLSTAWSYFALLQTVYSG
ncbi:uncharacterized protein LOC142982995 [Anticarsia gemmatalis]|uniref:uncharacterized protein LOC142982995 n=1 Tax=Anticarsia gemmatalis TaxID=129554 RepID=UPI003F75EFEE